MYCSNCGAQIDDKAVVCVKCGVPTANYRQSVFGGAPGAEGYDWLTTLLLCFFLGVFGVHSFYTRKTTIGVVQLLTLGGCGIWAFVDFIMILLGTFGIAYLASSEGTGMDFLVVALADCVTIFGLMGISSIIMFSYPGYSLSAGTILVAPAMLITFILHDIGYFILITGGVLVAIAFVFYLALSQ